MSGGAFDYKQDAGREIADKIDAETDGITYGVKTEAKFRLAAKTLRQAAARALRSDWVPSADDGKETFNKRWLQDGLPIPAEVE